MGWSHPHLGWAILALLNFPGNILTDTPRGVSVEILYPAKLGGDCLSPDWHRTELGTWEGITAGLSLRWLSHISVG